MEMKIVSSGEELLREATRLSGEGWDVIRIDEPERASVGYMGFRGGPEDEEVRELVWPFLGRPLDFNVEVVEAAEYVEALRREDAIVADDPKQRMLGVALYNPEEGTSRVVKTSITQFRRLDQAVREYVEERRAFLKDVWSNRLPDPPYSRRLSS